MRKCVRFHHSAFVGQLGELFQIVAAINDAGVEEGSLQTATIALTLDPSPIRWARGYFGGARLRRALTD